MKQNKKGVSDVVTTVLIIMLTIAAIGVIAGFVVPFVKNSLQKSTECADYKGFYTFDESLSFNSNCYSGSTYVFSIKAISAEVGGSTFVVGKGVNATNYSVAPNKKLIENVDRIKLILTRADGTTKSADIINDSKSGIGGVSMYGNMDNIVLPGPGGIVTYNYTSTDAFARAEVYPVLKSGRICADVRESINIKKSCE
jgi:flagellin-like protein